MPLLSEDWAAIDVFIQETLSRQDFPYLLVIDHAGIVRGSRDAAAGQHEIRAARRRSPWSRRMPDVTVQRYRLADRRGVLDFKAPILFQSTGKSVRSISGSTRRR